jgi:hypothetical protein
MERIGRIVSRCLAELRSTVGSLTLDGSALSSPVTGSSVSRGGSPLVVPTPVSTGVPSPVAAVIEWPAQAPAAVQPVTGGPAAQPMTSRPAAQAVAHGPAAQPVTPRPAMAAHLISSLRSTPARLLVRRCFLPY